MWNNPENEEKYRKSTAASVPNPTLHQSPPVKIRAGISFALARAVFDNLSGERRRVGRQPRGFGEGTGLNAFRW